MTGGPATVERFPTVAEKIAYAEAYIGQGWHVFVVRANKTTLPSCDTCRSAGPAHDRERCDHLVCHGFYAGTRDIARIGDMLTHYPGGLLALRTGQHSGIIALDFESHADSHELPTGLEVLDNWESYTQGMTLPETLTARTASGGIHRLYRTDVVIPGRNRILPSTDLKAEGGYIVLPPAPGRAWSRLGLVEAPESLLTWITQREARRSSAWNSRVTGKPVGHATGYNFHLFFRDGCPGGYRDDFINDLLFRLRKSRKTPDEARAIVRHAWERVAQPPYAKYYMSWEDVEYKLGRVWHTVPVDPLPDVVGRWVEQARAQREQQNRRTR